MSKSLVSSFVSHEHGPSVAVARLGELGFESGISPRVTRWLLDTFDGRVHRAGLQLELSNVDGAPLELILTGHGTARAHVSVDVTPRFAGDIPPSPFRSRLSAIVEIRALLPVISVESIATPFTLRDRSGKSLVTATLFEDIEVAEHADIDLLPWVLEVHESIGYPKPAGAVRDALDHLGLERVGVDVLGMAADSAGIDLAGFAGMPGVPLDPTMPAIDGFRAVLVNLADTIAANWDGAADQIDPEFLHDLRVAVRRTRSLLAQGKQILPEDVIHRARQEFGWLAGLTGPVRDLDVYLIEWESYTGMFSADALGALEPVRELLERRHENASAALATALRSRGAGDWINEWREWLTEAIPTASAGIHANRHLGHVVAKHIRRAHENLIDDGRLINADTPAEEVHNLRKDAKKLRYLFECFATLLPKSPRKGFVQRLKALQDNLGAHQDAEVHVAELRAISHELYAVGASPATMLAIGQLTEKLDQRRIEARVAFAERFDAYDTAATHRALADALEGIAP